MQIRSRPGIHATKPIGAKTEPHLDISGPHQDQQNFEILEPKKF